MSKKVLVEAITPVAGGPSFGRVTDPADFMRAQDHAHSHTEVIARDFIAGKARRISGFDYSLPGGLVFRVNGPGHIIDANGKSFEMEAAVADITLPTANAANPRIDLVYALIEENANAQEENRSFIQLGGTTTAQYNVPTEKHNRATVMVRVGAAEAAPVVPTNASNEIPLYYVRVDAGRTALQVTHITDQRSVQPPISNLSTRLSNLENTVSRQGSTTPAVQARHVSIGAPGGIWENKTLQDFLADYVNRRDTTPTAPATPTDPLWLPEIQTPELAPSHANSGKLVAVGALDGTTPVVDLPVGRRVAFADSVQTIEAAKFPAAQNARLVNKNANAPTQTRSNTVILSLAGVTEQATDAQPAFAARGGRLSGTFPVPTAAARRDRYIEIFAGHGPIGTSWFTYDTINDTVQTRVISGTAPAAIPGFLNAFSCGIASDLILLSKSGDFNNPARWYLLNASTGVCSQITTTTPTTNSAARRFWGGLVQDGLIIIIGAENDGTAGVWSYNVSTNTFIRLSPPGTVTLDYSYEYASNAACTYDLNKLVLFTGSRQQTCIYDFTANAWTIHNVSPAGAVPFWQAPVMANSGGRAILTYASGQVWELSPGTTPVWRQLQDAQPTESSVAIAATRTTTVLGAEVYRIGESGTIQQLKRSGLMQTTFGANTALTIGSNATYATFQLNAAFDLPWQVAKVYAALTGNLPPGSVRLEYSLDNGGTWQVIQRETVTTVLVSSNPGRRLLRVTLYRSGADAPVISTVNEQFEQVAGPSLAELVLRYTVTDTVNPHGLYIDNQGRITLETAIAQSTSTKALLLKVSPVANNPPTVKNYRNKRRVHLKIRGVRAAGVTPNAVNDLAVLPSFIKLERAAAGTGVLHELTDPSITFDTDIAIAGLATDGDAYILELST